MALQAGKLLVVAAVMMPWSASAQPRGASTIEAASPGQGYDYVIHLENTYDYKYNPQLRQDRMVLARQIVKPFCARYQIVGEDNFKTEIYGIWPGRPEYVVYVKCL